MAKVVCRLRRQGFRLSVAEGKVRRQVQGWLREGGPLQVIWAIQTTGLGLVKIRGRLIKERVTWA